MAVALLNERTGAPEIFLFNNTINVCKLNQGMVGNFFVQTFFTGLAEHSNFKIECPFNKVFTLTYL